MASLKLVRLRLGEGSLFLVEIDGSSTLAELKETITRQHEKEKVLQLLLAKDEDGGWVGVETGLAGQLMQGEIPPGVEEILNGDEQILPTETVTHWLETNHLTLPSTEQIHVLVSFAPVNGAASKPVRPEVSFHSCDGLSAFLEGEMSDKKAATSSPRKDTPQFRLVGREETLAATSKSFRKIIRLANSTASDHNMAEMPLCAGMSGLGKTRMLKEGGTVLHDVMELDPAHVASVIVPYANGYGPQQVEAAMSIEASFSWRLLYRFFLDNNCKSTFREWFKLRLPRNGAQLGFSEAVQVIDRKLRQTLQDDEPLYLFLGIDDYQRIESVGAQRRVRERSLLHELVDVVGDHLCTQPADMVVLPMFAGADWSVISCRTLGDSSHYLPARLPLKLLTVDEVLSAFESSDCYAALLESSEICRKLFLLGGVPRWAVQYLTKVMKAWTGRGKEGPVDLDIIESCFQDVWWDHVPRFTRALGQARLIRLAAFAVSGRLVQRNDLFDGDLTWSQLEDTSLCLLYSRVDRTTVSHEVHVPYAVLHSLCSIPDASSSSADMYFAASLKDLDQRVNSKLFDLQKWQLWEIFGACFYAIRINALLVLGRSTVTLGELLSGALMAEATRNISVRLVPARVLPSPEAFDASTPQQISRDEQESIDWTTSGNVVVNGDGGGIFFALEDASRLGGPEKTTLWQVPAESGTSISREARSGVAGVSGG